LRLPALTVLQYAVLTYMDSILPVPVFLMAQTSFVLIEAVYAIIQGRLIVRPPRHEEVAMDEVERWWWEFMIKKLQAERLV
jgi:hypothetical protein